MDEEQEGGVLSILRGGEGWDEEYSSISEFKHDLKEDALADEELEDGWVFWRENEQQLNNTTQLQQKIKTVFKHQRCKYNYYMVQFWGVVKVEGRNHHLSTSHHPFFVSHLQKGCCWYRELCINQVYSVEVKEEAEEEVEEEVGGSVEDAQLGGVGRAYRNKHPESTPDLRLYSTNEFPLRDDAARCGFRFYLALPLFDLDNNECCGVLELLSDWPGITASMAMLISSFTKELKSAGLRSTHINFNPISYFKDEMPDKYKQQVDTEIRDIEIREFLETVIQALPRLSLAQVWDYCIQSDISCCMERSYFITAGSKTVNSYNVTHRGMFDYLQACEFHHLQLDRNHFHQNLWDCNISKSPLEHYIQRGSLFHRFAINMQSVDNSYDPFVIEFFLKPECSSLHLLSRIIQMKLKSFKFEWEGQLREIFQSSQPNEIECESIDMLKVMNSYKEKFSESNFKEYMNTVDDTCCQRPTSVHSQKGWVFSCPSRERLCEKNVNSNTIFVPVVMKERIEEFMKKLTIVYEYRDYWIVQFWAPKMVEGRRYLETSAQPYALGCLAKGLASFRKECMKHHYFVDDEAKEEELGPPGRVFRNKHPEISPDLLLYSTKEFSIKNYAMHCCLQKYMVLPVFDGRKHECAGVLEFIGFNYFDLEDIGRALEAEKLQSSHIHLRPRFIAHRPTKIINCRKKALNEVSDAFSLIREIPHVHMAKMWVPYEKCDFISSNATCMELALSANDFCVRNINRIPTCEVHWIHVQPRKGIIGMALESESKSCFCQDLSEFSIVDQPLELNDRREKADVCFAICLQSLYTGDLTYVLEFFLNRSPQYLESFFKFLLPIMKQKLKSFKYACGKELGEELVVDVIQFYAELDQLDDVPIKFRSVQYGQMDHQQAQEPVQYVSDDMQAEQCNAPASVSKKTEKRKVGRSTIKVRSSDLLPLPLKMLRSYVENELNDGRGIPVALDDEVFGSKYKYSIYREDIIQFCDLEPISGFCIVVYIWQLYNKIKEENTLRRFQFVNPFTISNVPNGKSTTRVDALADRLNVASPDQLVLVPCNIGNHWILTVIEPYKNIVSMLDPLNRGTYDQTWKNVVKLAMKNFIKKYDKQTPTWEVIKVPRQPDSKQCGYYVMRFMKEIIEGLNTIDSGSLSSLFVKEEYSQTDIDEVRIEWTKCLSVQYGQMEHQQAEEAVQYVSDGMQAEQCKAAASVSKKTEKGKRKPGFNPSIEDLKPHYGKKPKKKDVAEELGVRRSTIKRSHRDHSIKRGPCTEKQTKNPCIYGKEKEQDSHQDVQPSSSGSLELLDTEQCRAAAASVSKKTEKEKSKIDFHPSLEDLRPHFGKLIKEVAESFNVSRSTFKRRRKSLGLKRWPNTEKQSRNLCRNSEKEKELDSQQEVQPSSSGNVRLLDVSLHQNGPCTNTERLIVEEEVEKVIMKVRFGQDIIKFELLLSLGVGMLLEEVATRLNLKMGTFKLKYLDEDNDEILVTGDADLQLCPKTRTATSRNCIQLFVQLVS